MAKRTEYKVKWIDVGGVTGLRKGFNSDYKLYAILEKNRSRRKVVYIGMTSEQCVTERLLKGHSGLIAVIRDLTGEITFALGKIVKPKKYREPTIRKVEAALVFKMKPIFNSQGVKHYNYGHVFINSVSKIKSLDFKVEVS